MKKEMAMFSIRISVDMKEKLDAIAEKKGTSRNEICAGIISDYIKYQEVMEVAEKRMEKEGNKDLDKLSVQEGQLIAQQVEDKAWLKGKITQIMSALMANDYDSVCTNTIMITSMCDFYCEVLVSVIDDYENNKKHLYKMLMTALNGIK